MDSLDDILTPTLDTVRSCFSRRHGLIAMVVVVCSVPKIYSFSLVKKEKIV